MLKIFNSLTRQKQEFQSIQAGKVGMYVCGMTVYDFCHMGHARVMVVFDMVARYLQSKGLQVNYVRNITDIDDKIIKRAAENSQSITALTEQFISSMHEDSDALGNQRPTAEPKATEHMPQIIQMIQRLLSNGYAYTTDSGDIFYAVHKFSSYGALSGKKTEELRAGERVEIQAAKHDPLDFVLWKASKPNEPSWPSPWGAGRPGWHIECSAMSISCLGEHFDIHGGGQDLQFPHHENEIAQSVAATGKAFANMWMHNGFVCFSGEKMSKSSGNFFTLREVMRIYKAEEIRFFILASHYRSPLNYSLSNLDKAKAALRRLYISLRTITIDASGPIDESYVVRFNQAMDDDFNTPKAIAVLHELSHQINGAKSNNLVQAKIFAATLKQLSSLLGLIQSPIEQFLQDSVVADAANLTDNEIQLLIAQRKQARQDKDFGESDRIRSMLKAQGVMLEDTGSGTLWQRC